MHDAHAFAAAAMRGLDHQRIADGIGFTLQMRRADAALIAYWGSRHAR
jgi:hypothetical protein